MLIILLAMCMTTSSKENTKLNNKCTIMCVQDEHAATAENKIADKEETILSPLNLFMIHAQ